MTIVQEREHMPDGPAGAINAKESPTAVGVPLKSALEIALEKTENLKTPSQEALAASTGSNAEDKQWKNKTDKSAYERSINDPRLIKATEERMIGHKGSEVDKTTGSLKGIKQVKPDISQKPSPEIKKVEEKKEYWPKGEFLTRIERGEDIGREERRKAAAEHNAKLADLYEDARLTPKQRREKEEWKKEEARKKSATTEAEKKAEAQKPAPAEGKPTEQDEMQKLADRVRELEEENRQLKEENQKPKERIAQLEAKLAEKPAPSTEKPTAPAKPQAPKEETPVPAPAPAPRVEVPAAQAAPPPVAPTEPMEANAAAPEVPTRKRKSLRERMEGLFKGRPKKSEPAATPEKAVPTQVPTTVETGTPPAATPETKAEVAPKSEAPATEQTPATTEALGSLKKAEVKPSTEPLEAAVSAPQPEAQARAPATPEAKLANIYGESVASKEHPDRNEDAMFLLPEKGAFGVFDGLGGHAAGDKASKIAGDTINRYFSGLRNDLDLVDTQMAVRNALEVANKAVYDQAQEDKSNMATTATVGLVWQGAEGKKAVIGNVGDSRVYLLRNNTLEQVTLDDKAEYRTMTENDARQLQAEMNNVVDPQELTPQKRQLFSSRNEIDKVIGDPTVSPTITTVDLQDGDKLLACSDGISDSLTDKEIQTILSVNPDANRMIRELINASQARSQEGWANLRAKPDDMTALIVEVGVKDKLESALPAASTEQTPATTPVEPVTPAEALEAPAPTKPEEAVPPAAPATTPETKPEIKAEKIVLKPEVPTSTENLQSAVPTGTASQPTSPEAPEPIKPFEQRAKEILENAKTAINENLRESLENLDNELQEIKKAQGGKLNPEQEILQKEIINQRWRQASGSTISTSAAQETPVTVAPETPAPAEKPAEILNPTVPAEQTPATTEALGSLKKAEVKPSTEPLEAAVSAPQPEAQARAPAEKPSGFGRVRSRVGRTVKDFGRVGSAFGRVGNTVGGRVRNTVGRVGSTVKTVKGRFSQSSKAAVATQQPEVPTSTENLQSTVEAEKELKVEEIPTGNYEPSGEERLHLIVGGQEIGGTWREDKGAQQEKGFLLLDREGISAIEVPEGTALMQIIDTPDGAIRFLSIGGPQSKAQLLEKPDITQAILIIDPKKTLKGDSYEFHLIIEASKHPGETFVSIGSGNDPEETLKIIKSGKWIPTSQIKEYFEQIENL